MTVTEEVTKTNVQVKLDELTVPLDVQRALDQSRVDKMAAIFNPDAMGSVTVSLRPDGTRNIIDGQHRVAAAIQAGHEGPVDAIQYEGLSVKDEAALFLLLNNTRQIHIVDKFRARVLSQEESALAMKSVLDELGWVIRIGQSQWSFMAVGSMEKIYQGAGVVKGGDINLLTNVMAVITSAWNGAAPSASSGILMSLGKFLGWYGKEVDYEKIIQELGNMKPGNFMADVRMVREMNHIDLGNAGARVLVGIHNKGRRNNRLPEWVNR